MTLIIRTIIIIFIITCTISFINHCIEIKDKKRDWNNGICPKCGEKWKRLATDIEGNGIYTCVNSHYIKM